MSVRNTLRSATTPSAALLVLADEIEKLQERVLSLEEADAGGGWNEWDDHDMHVQLNEELQEQVDDKKREEVERTVAALEEKLIEIVDPEDRQALEATIRLKREELKVMPCRDDDGERAKIDSGEGEATVEIPAPTPEQIQWRESLLEQLSLEDTLGEGADENFVRGGPLWLYYGNRDFVVGLPDDLKRAFVKDVNQQSPAEARELGRDLLKDLTSGDGAEETLGRALGNG